MPCRGLPWSSKSGLPIRSSSLKFSWDSFSRPLTCLNYLIRYWFPHMSGQGLREEGQAMLGNLGGWRSKEVPAWSSLLTSHSDPHVPPGLSLLQAQPLLERLIFFFCLFFNIYLFSFFIFFIFLAASGLRCGTQGLRCGAGFSLVVAWTSL